MRIFNESVEANAVLSAVVCRESRLRVGVTNGHSNLICKVSYDTNSDSGVKEEDTVKA